MLIVSEGFVGVWLKDLAFPLSNCVLHQKSLFSHWQRFIFFGGNYMYLVGQSTSLNFYVIILWLSKNFLQLPIAHTEIMLHASFVPKLLLASHQVAACTSTKFCRLWRRYTMLAVAMVHWRRIHAWRGSSSCWPRAASLGWPL